MTDDDKLTEFLRRLREFDGAPAPMRGRFPGVGEFVDALRAFDPDCKVRWARNEQTGDEVGKPMQGEFVRAARVEKILPPDVIVREGGRNNKRYVARPKTKADQ